MRRILILTTAVAVGACVKPAERPSAGAGAANSTPAAPAAVVPDSIAPAPPIVAAAPVGGAQARGLGHLMVGTWDIFPTGVGGPHLSIMVRSARGATFQGELTRALAGDVFLDVERFEPFTGSVGPDSVVRVTIGWKEQGPPPAEFVGRISGGEWILTRFVWGGEQQVLPGRTWTGRRAKP